jgi:hypothetical protein
VHLFCPSLGFLAEEQPRLLKTGEAKRHFLPEVHIKFFRLTHELLSERDHWKNYKFIVYLLFSKIYLNLFVHSNNFFKVFFISLPTKHNLW